MLPDCETQRSMKPEQRTVAVTGPPTNYDFKTRVLGGSGSPLGYASKIHSIAIGNSLAQNSML
jgi:hypothetical protein